MTWKYFNGCLLLLAVSCSGGGSLSFDEHGGEIGENGPGGSGDPVTELVSVEYLKSMYVGEPKIISEEVAIRGRVVENDFSGNFYHMLVVGDGSANIEIRVEGDYLYMSYPRGSVVTVQCNGLMLASEGGMVRLGVKSSGENPYYPIDAIGNGELDWRIRHEEDPVVEILPDDTLTIRELTPFWLSRLVGFEQVQFIDEEVDLYWTENGADTDRHLIDRYGDTLVVRTSRHANFADLKLPSGSGYIEGILECFNGKFQLRMGDDIYAPLWAPRFEVSER